MVVCIGFTFFSLCLRYSFPVKEYRVGVWVDTLYWEWSARFLPPKG